MTQSYHDHPYLTVMKHIMKQGVRKGDRTGTGTISTFGVDMRFDLSDGTIPLLTTKKVHWLSIIEELRWYIRGSTNNQDLEQAGVRIWREWADANGELGPLYGAQLRKWDGHIDQLQDTIDIAKMDPDSRRMVVSYWNPTVLPLAHLKPHENPALGRQALAPCHYTWQLYTALNEETGRRKMSLKLTQRSADLFLGVPFNIAQYSILLHMIAHLCDMDVGEFIWSGGDTHIYTNLFDQCIEQMQREPYPSPKLSFARKLSNINDFEFGDFILHDYQHHPAIKGKVAV